MTYKFNMHTILDHPQTVEAMTHPKMATLQPNKDQFKQLMVSHKSKCRTKLSSYLNKNEL